MEPIVLVTYSTRYGSTEEVAHAVAETLSESGVAVETLPIRNVHSLERYSAIVLGVPLYMSLLHKDARRFLRAHRNALTKMPVALFVLGPVQKDEKDWTGARMQLKKELAKYPWFTPVSQQIFGGKFDPAKLGFPFSLFPPLRKLPAGDARDWTAIRGWASDLALALRPVHRDSP
jgi:menaquinone-dependent protoporphyrinogen oxidase